jgi:hypothetical protein
MRLLILTCCLISIWASGQTRIISGRVIDEYYLTTIPEVKIQNRDTVLLCVTDLKGNFKIEIPSEANELILSIIGMEWTTIKFPANCDYLEIIMMYDVTYDYVTIQTENRNRYKRFKDLKKQHHQAYQKNIFTSDSTCFEYIFSKH